MSTINIGVAMMLATTAVRLIRFVLRFKMEFGVWELFASDGFGHDGCRTANAHSGLVQIFVDGASRPSRGAMTAT